MTMTIERKKIVESSGQVVNISTIVLHSLLTVESYRITKSELSVNDSQKFSAISE